MMDTLSIEQLKVKSTIGVHEWEKHITQTLLIDIHIHCDIRQAAEQDQLQYTFDYSAIAHTITEFFANHSFNLIETAAEKVAALLKEKFTMDSLTLRIEKPGAVPSSKIVSIEIKR